MKINVYILSNVQTCFKDLEKLKKNERKIIRVVGCSTHTSVWAMQLLWNISQFFSFKLFSLFL